MKHHEFWHPRLFEIPYYLHLAFGCLVRGLPPLSLLRANYGIDHGGFAFASKFAIQTKIGSDFFPPTALLSKAASPDEKNKIASAFARNYGFPLILKPDAGFTGKGVRRVRNANELAETLPLLSIDYLLQGYLDLPFEFGVFYARVRGKEKILGINGKLYPQVVGDGKKNIGELAERHPRFTPHWRAFLLEHDSSRVPNEGERITLSYIGSHTMGCLFADESRLVTPRLEDKIFSYFRHFPGFNFGRLDVKCRDEKALMDGDIALIEVNGVDSLPTWIFDPSWTLCQSYRALLGAGTSLLASANEHRRKTMPRFSWKKILKETEKIVREVNEQHEILLRNSVAS
ncbi:MAG: hypothetical protein JNM63_17450 [Spirochaetia bacterium]|nr:hypothetical protein [Spirochaetia bacterium]